MALKKLKEKYSYNDYKNWEDSEDWEIINGVAYNMSPSPSSEHQEIGSKILIELGNFLKNKECKLYYELDVILSDENILKPDIIVVCDKSKIKKRGIFGAPDLAIEILSPSTSIKDKTLKLELYKKYGVKEYWLVDPIYKDITVHIFEKDEIKLYTLNNENIPVNIFEKFAINMDDIFEKEETKQKKEEQNEIEQEAK
ncbi:Uma2 family endonuclease [Haliovirga abyssi]|uniref:Putative restriction endonuclease domain-containing protein n=1 Tax=Haliovirga abyssi TaxID=2996794 RepID=A0AAU9DFY5_9FUSO|nr:Uma2 family endonuclease [Haliovirga abyssi]BDU49574.1 hypothetical protein HLVA_01430 [Haliovirga abyssi]